MAADFSEKQAPLNPCCQLWRDRYSKLQEKRNALRQALKLFEQQLDKIQADNLALKKACEEERARAEVEKEGREKELTARVSLESEISTLKSEISTLQQKGRSHAQDKNEEVKLLQARVLEREKEIEELKELLETEKTRADSEKKNADAEKKKATEAWKYVKAEKSKADEERARAEVEKESKEKELAARVSLEYEISTLKSEISTLQRKGTSHAQDKNEEVKLLQARVLEREREIKKFKELLETQKTRADSEKKNADAEKKKATEAWKYVKAEKGKADEERRLANIERNKAEEYRLQLEALSKEAGDAKSKLVSVTLKLEEGNKKLEAEKKKVLKEKKRADSEMDKTEEQKKLAEAGRKLAEEEKCHAENLSLQLEEARKRIVELQKQINEVVQSRHSGDFPGCTPEKNTDSEFSKINSRLRVERSQKVGTKSVVELLENQASKTFRFEKQKDTDEKNCADSEKLQLQEHKKLGDLNRAKTMEESSYYVQLSRQLKEARGMIDELQKQIYYLLSSRKMVEASAVLPTKYMNPDFGEVKLLKKQLKLEKMNVKRAKQVAKLEKSRNIILRQELGHLKSDFVQFSHRLDVMDKIFSPKDEGIDVPEEKAEDRSDLQMLKLNEKVCGVDPFHMYLQSESELLKPCCITASDCFLQTLQPVVASLSLSGGNCSESISGIDSKDSKLESLLGGSSRKMLQSSAINSSSASFSDGIFVGSQEKGAFSVTTSSKLIEESLNTQRTNSSMSGEVNKMRCSKNLAVVAEDSVRSPLRIVGIGSGDGPTKKRQKVLDAIKSIELLHSDGKKLHLQMEEKLSDLHNMLNGEVGNSLEEAYCVETNLQENSYVKHEQLNKKRKASHRENEGILLLCNSDEAKKTEKVDATIHKDARVSRQASQPTIDLIGTGHACGEGISDSVISVLQNFEEVAHGDYMKLLDLDNPADEQCYRTAMEMLLSPTLPEIEFQGDETQDIGELEPLAKERFYGSLSNEKENMLPPCSFDVISVEINSNELKKRVSGNSHTLSLHENESPVDSFDLRGNNVNGFHSTMQAGEACDHNDQHIRGMGTTFYPCGSMVEGVKFTSESELGTPHNNILKHFVVFQNNKDNSSISRIFYATKSCMARCSLATQTEWILQKILLALSMEENLFSKEKACVFFSLLLLNFSKDALGKSGNFWNRDFTVCLDSFARHVSAVMYDVEAKKVFDGLCLDELLSLIEDFLMYGKVMTCANVTSGMLDESNSKINGHPDGVNAIFSYEGASAEELVAGSIILASISAVTNHTGFICEASFNISRIHRCNPSLVLTILHIFAYLGGEKLFTLSKYSLTMAVLKSIVMYLERGNLPVGATSFLPSATESKTEFYPCAECPFSKDAVSVDIAISLVLERLKSYAQSGTMNLLSHEQAKSSQELYSGLDIDCGASCFLKKYKIPSFQLESFVNVSLCHVADDLSLVELLACNMRWDWTCTKIIPELLRILESPMQKSFAVAIVILLGQLGRLGVDACGYEDKEVTSLRSKLCAFLLQETTARAGLSIQIATVTALLWLLSLNFDQIIQINTNCLAVSSQLLPANHIRKWFSTLGKEDQALSISLLQSSDLVTKL